MSSPTIPEDSFSSDTDFEDDDVSESSTDVEAKLGQEEVFDTEFFECYLALKKKDDKIYDKSVKFFSETSQPDQAVEIEKGESDKPSSSKSRMTLLDFQLANKSDEPDELPKEGHSSYHEKELNEIKQSILQTGTESESDDGEFLLTKSKHKKDDVEKVDKVKKSLVKHEQGLWGNPSTLTDDEKFLRDYILNKRYINGYEDKSHFSKNLDDLSDAESDEKSIDSATPKVNFHSQEDNFHELKRIPRNSTKTIRDLVEKNKKREKRLKRVEKLRRRKKATKSADFEDMVGDLPTKFPYQETEPVDYGMTAEEILMAPEEELEKKLGGLRKSKRSKKGSAKKDNNYDETEKDLKEKTSEVSDKNKKKKKRRKRGLNHKKVGVAPDRLLAYGLSKNKLKKASLL